jgi:serine/threonine-protein kinase 24/25/MST4
LNHRIIKSAKKTSYLTELIDRYERWVAENGDDSSSTSDDGSGTTNKTTKDPNWEFGTTKVAKGAAPAMGKAPILLMSFTP